MKYLILLLIILLSCSQKIENPISKFIHPTITLIEGQGFIKHITTFKQTVCNDLVLNKDTIYTTNNSRIRITFNDSDYVIIGENSTVTFSISTDSIIMKVIYGKIYSNAVILPKKLSYKIITSKISTSVKGTAYSVEVIDSNETHVTVFEGKVEVIDNDSLCPINVTCGERATMINKSQCQVRQIRFKELDQVVHWIGQSCLKLRKRIELLNNKNFLNMIAKVDTLDLEIKALTKTDNLLSFRQQNDFQYSAPVKLIVDTFGYPIKKEVKVPIDVISIQTKEIVKTNPVTFDTLRNPIDIQKTIQDNIHLFNYAYNQFIKIYSSKASGKIVVRFKIQTSGQVDEINIISSTFENVEFESTITKLVKNLKFKQVVEKVGPTSIVYPFIFNTES